MYVLKRNESGSGAGEYRKAGMLKAPTVVKAAEYGVSMGSAGTLVVVGATGHTVGGVACGAAHVYRWDGNATSTAVGGVSVLERSTSFGYEGLLVPPVGSREVNQSFGHHVAVAVRGGTGPFTGAEYVAVNAIYEDCNVSGNASAGWAVTPPTTAGTSVANTGGVYVYGGRPLKQLAHLKARSQAVDQKFGRRLSMSRGGVLAISTVGSCELYMVDLW